MFVDWRGFYGSKDAMTGVKRLTWRRGQDGYDSVEWCATQAWCDGKVGTWGGSALGKQQFDTAAEQPPHLVCCVPLIAYMGERYEAYYEGGVMLEAHVKTLDKLGFDVSRKIVDTPLPGAWIWKIARNRSYSPEKIAVPCLMISGWWDNYPADVMAMFNDLVARGGTGARAESKLIMGPWSHTAVDLAQQGDLTFENASGYSAKITMQFFDYFLRGKKDSGWASVPRVNAYQCGDEKWITGETWTAMQGQPQTLHLLGDGTIQLAAIADSATPQTPSSRTYTYDPHNASPTIGGQNLPPLTHGPKDVASLEKRSDVLVYRTDVLNAQLRLRGDAELSLTLTCNRTDCDLQVRLCDVFADGKSVLVSETIQRAKLRDGKKVQLLKPGQPYPLTLRFDPQAYTWLPGHRLELLVTSGNSPRHERNPHTGADHWDDATAQSVTVTLQHTPAAPALLRLPLAP
ncbi:MAG: CocE/NonD family hydrolase [bacterium]